MALILGIDPGSRVAGYGIVRAEGEEIRHVTHGIIALSDQLNFHERLLRLGRELQSVYDQFQPGVTVIEKIFLGKNTDSAFRLGHARGVCLYHAAAAGTEVVEYATRSVKKGVTGNGASSKETVQMILFTALNLSATEQLDASDALALAYYHARNLSVRQNLERGRRWQHDQST